MEGLSVKILKTLQRRKMRLINELNTLDEKEKTLKEKAIKLKRKLSAKELEERVDEKLQAILTNANQEERTRKLENNLNETRRLVEPRRMPAAPQSQLFQIKSDVLQEGFLKPIRLKGNVVFSWHYQKLS